MHAPENMTRIVDGKKYSVKTASLVADDEYFDGHNMEHGGRNQFLYKTPRGAFFTVCLTQWQEERDTLKPVTEAEARQLFEGPLTEHAMTWEEAFEQEPEEPEGERGRPTMFDEKMRQTAIYLPEDMIEWLKAQPGTGSETVRDLVREAMKK